MIFPEFPHLFFAMLNQKESIKCRTATFFLSLFECKKILSGKTLAINSFLRRCVDTVFCLDESLMPIVFLVNKVMCVFELI